MNRRFTARPMATLCAAICVFLPSLAAAQVTVSSIISYPGGSSIATSTLAAYVDVYGNIFVIDTTGARVLEIPANGGPVSVIATGLTASRGVAADSLGNIYIGQLNNTYVTKYPVGGGAPVNLPTSGTTISGRQFMLALDSASPANLYVTDTNGGRVEKINTSTGVSTTDFADTEGTKGIAFDAAGDLFTTNFTNSTLTELPAGSTTPVTVSLTGLSSPYGIAFDKAGDLYIMNEGTSNLLEYPVGFTATTTPTVVATTGSGATSVMLNPRSDIIYSTGSAHIYSIQSGAGNFYGVPVGSTSAASLVSITYTFTAATTLAAVPAVYTSNNSATALFAGSTLSGAPTTPLCTASKAYAANATCILNVAFLPTQVGVATGSVSLISSTGAVLATTPLMGVGYGPAAGFSPGTQSTLLSSLGQPEGVAVDAGGNTYLADLVNQKITKTTSGGTTTPLAFTGLAQPFGVAVDGAGSVYVSDAHNNAVYKLTSGGTQTPLATSGLSSPAGIAVDGFNNVYIADSGNARVVEITPAGVQSVIGFTGLTSPMWVAVDFSGDIFVSDSGKVYEYSALGVQTTVTTTGLGSPAGLAVAANGTLYIADTTNKDVYVLPYTGISGIPSYGPAFTLASGFTTPTGLALSGAGVLTIADSGAKSVSVLDQTKQTLTFPSTATNATSAAMTAKLQDVGNGSLTLSNLVVSSGYAQVTPLASTDCGTTTTVPAAGYCNVNILFEPTTLGSDPGTVTLTDNALNATSATQVINLVGTGITPTTTMLSSSNTNPVYGTPFNIIATVTPTTGSGTVATGDTVTFTVDGGTPVNEITNSSGVATYPTPTGFAAGQHTVVATFKGDTNYAASTSTTFTITVTPYQLTVSAQPQTRAYGVANAAFVATYATFQYNDTASVLTGAPTFNTTAGTTSDPGVYPITVTVGTLAAANYTFVASNSSITVTQATASITFTPFNPATYIYGASPITPTTTSNSPVQIIYSIVSGHATVTGTGAGQAISINGIGTVVVAANQASNTDYTAATQQTQSFNVTPAVITVTAQNVSITQGSAIPTLTASYTGFKYSDTQSVISGAPALSTTATSSSPTGTYPVTCGVGTLTATNYTFTCVNGTLTITGTTPQTINFPALGNITYGQTPPTLSATATPSGLTVTYTIASGPATLGVNNVLNITGIGKVCVTASQPGNGTYAAAPSVTNCFTVSAATLTVTPNPVNINYGAAIPTLSATISGYVNGDGPSVVSGAANLTTTAVLNSPVGSYPINCAVGSLTAANYIFNCLTGTLTISADPQQITFPPLSNVTYGVVPITLGATTNSGLTITYTVTTPTTASVSGSVLTILAVGQVCVTASQAGNATTAAATSVSQCFTVSPASLTVTASNVTIPFGTAIPTTFAYKITGFQYNDTVSVVSGTPVITTTATASSPGGTYPITPTIGSLVAANYIFPTANFIPGVLTISADTQVITFAALPNVPETTTSVTLTATASSGLPITYTLSSTSPATVNNTTGVLSLTGAPGTVCVTATQPGNSSWLAATPVLQCFNVTSTTGVVLTSSAPIINTGVSVTLTATISNKGIPKPTPNPTGTVSFYAFSTTTSSTLLGMGTVNTAGTTATLTSTTLPSGTLSITAVYSGDNYYSTSTSPTLSVLVVAPDFTVSATPSIVTATASTPATSLLTLTPVGGYSNTVTFACANLPKTLACTFAPPALNFYPGTGTATLPQATTVTITYSPQNAMLHVPASHFLPRTQTAMAAVLLGLFAWGIPLLSTRRRGLHKRLRHLTLLLLAIGVFLGLSGCGAGAAASTEGTYNIVVVMSDGTGLTHNQTLTVTTQ